MRRNWYLCAAAMENTMVIFQKIRKKKPITDTEILVVGMCIPKRIEARTLKEICTPMP